MIKKLFLFFIILTCTYVTLYIWQVVLHYWPISQFVNLLSTQIVSNLILISDFVFSSLFDFQVITLGNEIEFSNNHKMIIIDSCSALKQQLIFIILIALFPGPLKKKLWFIPFGVAIIYLTTILRVLALGVCLELNPELFNLIHNHVFKIIFFTVIFLLWLWWVEKIAKDAKWFFTLPST